MTKSGILYLDQALEEVSEFIPDEFEVVVLEEKSEIHDRKHDEGPGVIVIKVEPGDGLESFLKLLKQDYRLSELPIVCFGHPDREHTLKCYALGVTTHHRLPLDAEIAAKDILNQLQLSRDRITAANQVSTMMEELTEQLIHSERLATLGTLSSSVAHEINNPSAFISTNVQTLEKFWSVVDPVLQKLQSNGECDARLEFILKETPLSLQRIMDGVRRISKIVSHLKSFSQWKTGDRRPVSLTTCIDQTMLLLSSVNENRLEVDIDLSENLPDVTGDMQQLTQVLLNVITNSVHAMEDQEANPWLVIEGREQGGDIFLELRDNGKGIPEEALSRIWDPFFTTKERTKGSGLGLNICKKIIEAHGGSIQIRNRQEGGVVCTILLPINQEKT